MERIRIICPACGKELDVKEKLLGNQGRPITPHRAMVHGPRRGISLGQRITRGRGVRSTTIGEIDNCRHLATVNGSGRELLGSTTTNGLESAPHQHRSMAPRMSTARTGELTVLTPGKINCVDGHRRSRSAWCVELWRATSRCLADWYLQMPVIRQSPIPPQYSMGRWYRFPLHHQSPWNR